VRSSPLYFRPGDLHAVRVELVDMARRPMMEEWIHGAAFEDFPEILNAVLGRSRRRRRPGQPSPIATLFVRVNASIPSKPFSRP
jgi:hypothetical protein